MAKRGHYVILATRDDKDGVPFFELNYQTIFKHFNFKFSKWRRLIGKILLKLNLIDRFPYFNRELLVCHMLNDYCKEKKIDVVIVSGCQELIDFTAYGELDCPIIMMMHSHPKAYFTKKRDSLYRRYINKASAIQVLMPSYSKALPDNYKGKIVCIGTPVCSASDISLASRKNIIVYLARIEKGKQQHLLIEAFAKIANQYPDWQVHFYGAEADKKYVSFCHSLISTTGLGQQIIFKGVTANVPQVLRSAGVCAFPSLFDGFSLAQTEAMAYGLPVIGFDYCSGVNELIKDGYNGFLVKDVDDFAEKLDVLLDDENLRLEFGHNAQEIAETYSMDNIISQWENLINFVIEGEKNNS